jgi:hypothetical protein
MALQQPLLPVFPVAKELISKTKWGARTTKTLEEGPITWANLQTAVSESNSRRSFSRSRKTSIVQRKHVSEIRGQLQEAADNKPRESAESHDTTGTNQESPRLLRKAHGRPLSPK